VSAHVAYFIGHFGVLFSQRKENARCAVETDLSLFRSKERRQVPYWILRSRPRRILLTEQFAQLSWASHGHAKRFPEKSFERINPKHLA
jgi:hypothetical protein